jgi:phosphatidylserine/phosphatidylglycerophosphate/cardiolipin synthase-like enzyme
VGIATQQGKILLRDEKIGFGEECCCGEDECEGCFVVFTGTFNWTFTAADCNGNPVNMAGTIVDGTDPNGELSVFCTEDGLCLGDTPVAGLLLSVFNGVCQWRGIVPGGIFNFDCNDARTLPGTYTLKRCTNGQTGTLVIA